MIVFPAVSSLISKMLDKPELDALGRFLTYFSNPKSNIRMLRHKVAFHNDWKFAMRNLRAVPGDAALFIYSDGTVGNTLFHFSDLGMAFVMSDHTKPGEFPAGLDVIQDEVLALSRDLLRFSSACLALILRRYVGPSEDQIELDNVARLGEPRIPFFMAPPAREYS
jgi:hypothetical protein